MTPASKEWGTYGIEIVFSREKAEVRNRHWQQRAARFPGAEVRVMQWRDPLGGETYLFCTRTLELVPQALRGISMGELLEKLSVYEERPSAAPPDPPSDPQLVEARLRALESRLAGIEARLRALRSGGTDQPGC